MTEEVWRPVVGYENEYEVSSLGRVRRVKAAQGARVGRILAQQEMPLRGGYMSVGLTKGCLKKRFRVHRLVADAFLGPSDLPLVRHLDGDPKNNSAANLMHGTVSENAQDRTAHGKSRTTNQNSAKTHCIRGHEFTPENTIIRRQASGGRTGRRCRSCTSTRRSG